MRLICARLNWQCELIALRSSDLLPALDANKIDLAVGGIIITPKRQLNYLFSIPYLPSEGGFMTLVQSPITNVNELTNKRIGVLQGKAFMTYLEQNPPMPITLVPYNLYENLALALKNNEVDAVFINYYSALYLEHQYPTLLRALKPHFNLGYGIGIAATLNNKDKIDQINPIIAQLQADGTFVRLYNYYFEFFIPK